MPAALRAAQGRQPLARELLAGLTLPKVWELLLAEDWPVEDFLREEHGAYDISPSTWESGEHGADVLVRRVHLEMPTPADVPGTIKRLVGIPHSTRVTMLFTAYLREGELVLVQRTRAHEVTCGESFWVQDIFSFRPAPVQGLVLSRWTEVQWVQTLPWTYDLIKYFIEKKTLEGAMAGIQTFARVLEGAAQ